MFATESPGEGLFSWVSAPSVTTNTCGMPGYQLGNGFEVQDVDAVSRTYLLRPDSSAYQAVGCTYTTTGAFQCGPQVTTFDLADYGASGIITVSVEHEGLFDYRVMSFDGVNHTFTPSWAFSFSTHLVATCSADPATCDYAAANGFGWLTLPCEVAYEGATFSFDDPTFPE